MRTLPDEHPRRVAHPDARQRADAHTIRALGVPALVLMERAALACIDALGPLAPDASFCVLAGHGNNGGDGLAIARILRTRGWPVEVVRLDPERAPSPDNATQLDLARRAGVAVRDPADLDRALHAANTWIDAGFGIGLRGPLGGPAAALLERAAKLRTIRNPRVLAVDIPSGVDAATGACHPAHTLRADRTVAFAAACWGNVLPAGAAFGGELVIADIGIPVDTIDSAPILDAANARARYRPYRPDDHKGTRGHLLVVAGSDAAPGAAILAARAALRAGAGLVTLCAPPSVRAAAAAAAPELMTTDRDVARGHLPDRFDALLVGPGLGLADDDQALVDHLLRSAGPRPIVADADALTLLGRTPPDDRPRPGPLLLTPHPAELARLLGTSTDRVLTDLPAAARQAARERHATVVAKTAGAVVAHGDTLAWIEPGAPGMATAGSGDVLAGVIAALAMRHPPEDAAALGAWLHARAGAHTARRCGDEGTTAPRLIDHLDHAFADLRGDRHPA